MNKVIVFVVLLANISCSLNFFKFSQNKPKFDDKEIEQNYCISKNKLNIFGPDKNNIERFNSFLQLPHIKKSNYSFEEKFVLLVLYYFSARPDLVSINSHTQLLDIQNKKFNYYETKVNNDNSSNILGLLSRLLTNSNSKKSIIELIRAAQLLFPNRFSISDELAKSILTNKKVLYSSPTTKKHFFQAQHPLTSGESITKYPYKNLYKKIKMGPYLNENILKTHNNNIQCNIDFNLYNNGIYPISQRKIESIVFGVQQNKRSLLAILHLNNSKYQPSSISPSNLNNINLPSIPFCFVNKKNRRIAYISLEGRDPGQHLFHLDQLGIENVNSVSDVVNRINFPRHIFLVNPMRIIFESKKMNTQQLDSFHKLDIPLYHVNTIGSIWAFADFGKTQSIIKDHRSNGIISCQK